MPYLLDTDVVVELRKATPDQNVVSWQRSHSDADAYLSVLVIGEIRQGVQRLRSRDTSQADALEAWLAGLVTTYRDRILPITVDIAQQWGRLNVPPQTPPTIDGLMAATALVHRLTLVTRNVSDVTPTGVDVVNPFDAS